ncbi:TAXI family TRAP transporter solute-binding subunit [Aestuariivirga sp.]|uniref:TAXI family TRAP transporter solute-binding subunit n=1 Tax=Aestuariivirga sp. TaxID=2650926 RepID=UPI003016D73A
MNGYAWKLFPLFLGLISLPAFSAEEQSSRFFASLGTGSMSGVYYPVGGAICAIVNRDLQATGVRCSRETTPGSVYNVDALESDELEFAIVQSDVAYAAAGGKGAFTGKPFAELRTVMVLYPELVTVVVRPEIHEVADLAGKRVNAGPVGSGARVTWATIIQALGLKESDAPQIVDMPADAIGTALCSGQLDAEVMVMGHPSARVASLLAGCPLNLLAVKGSAIDELVASTPYLRSGQILGSLYGLPNDTPSLGVSAVLMTTADMNDKAVEAFARALATNVQALKREHPALAELSIQQMVSGNLPAPLHPAAEKVFKEMGVLK